MNCKIEPISNVVKQKLYGVLSLGSDIGPSESDFCSQCSKFWQDLDWVTEKCPISTQ